MPRLARLTATLRVFCISCVLLAATAADAQWVALGRKALGKVKEMTQSEPTGAPGYSVATVLVEGDAQKVYATALRSVESSTRVRVTKKVPEAGRLEFADGKQVIGIDVTQVGEKVVHVVVASAAAPGKPDETSQVVAAALRICKEMGAACSVAGPDAAPAPAPAAAPR